MKIEVLVLDEEELMCLEELLDAYLTPYGSHFLGIDNECARNILNKIESILDARKKGDK